MKDYISDLRNKLKELAKTKCSELFKTPIAYNGLGSTDFWIDGYIHGSDRFKTIALYAIVFAQLDEQYSKEELERELGCTEQELLDIADGDEAMIENLGLGE